MTNYLDIALIIISVLLIVSVIMQSKGAGLGGLTGAESGSVFTARRGVERTHSHATMIIRLAPKRKPNAGESRMAAAVLRKPAATSVDVPPLATAAPASPPINACDELDGMP